MFMNLCLIRLFYFYSNTRSKEAAIKQYFNVCLGTTMLNLFLRKIIVCISFQVLGGKIHVKCNYKLLYMFAIVLIR